MSVSSVQRSTAWILLALKSNKARYRRGITIRRSKIVFSVIVSLLAVMEVSAAAVKKEISGQVGVLYRKIKCVRCT